MEGDFFFLFFIKPIFLGHILFKHCQVLDVFGIFYHFFMLKQDIFSL